MGDDITIGVTEIVNNIEVTAQPNDQIVDISVIDNADEVTLNITPTVIEINVNKGSSYARWGTIYGNLTDQTDLTNALILKADLVDGKVPAYQLPSFVDDVVEVANYAALPAMGEIGKIYVTLDNNKIYRWSGSIYIEIASNNAIWGAITGTLSNQTDLQNALDLKQNSLSWMSPLSVAGGTVSISYSGVSTNGALSSTDWNTFNGKANDNAVVHLTGDETITGQKVFNNSSNSISIYSNNTSVGTGIYSDNSAIGTGIQSINSSSGLGFYSQNTSTGKGIQSNNTSTGRGIYSQNSSTGYGIYSTNGSSGTGFYSTNSSTGHGIRSLNSSTGIGFYSTNTLNGEGIRSDNLTTGTGIYSSSAGEGTGIYSNNYGVGTGIYSNNSNTGTGFYSLNSSTGEGIRSLNSSTGTGIYSVNPSTGVGIRSDNTSNGQAVYINNTSNGQGVFSNNTGSGIAIYSQNESSGKNLVLNNTTAATGMPFTIQKQGVDKFTINDAGGVYAAGNVGIGTTSPASKLHVKGSSNYDGIIDIDNSTTTGGGLLRIKQNGVTSGFISVVGSALGNSDRNMGYAAEVGLGHVFYTNDGSERMRITSGGNVGIGTSSPNGLLHLYGGDSNNPAILTLNSISGGGGNSGIYFRPEQSVANSNIHPAQAAILAEDNNFSSHIKFLTKTTGAIGNSLAERMRITSGGNVGIGTTSPAQKLDVSGIIRASSDFEQTGNSVFKNTSYDMYLQTDAAGAGIIFRTSGATERMRITSGGAVLVGTTADNGGKLTVSGGQGGGFRVEQNGGAISLPSTGLSFSTGYSVGYIKNANGSGSVVDLYIEAARVSFSNLGTGLVYSSSGFLTNTNPSDSRLKDNITDLQYGLNEILKLRPVSYNWKNDNINQGKQFGFIAQEVQEVMPELVKEFETEDGERLGLDKEGIYAALVNAIKELKAEIEILKNK